MAGNKVREVHPSTPEGYSNSPLHVKLITMKLHESQCVIEMNVSTINHDQLKTSLVMPQ